MALSETRSQFALGLKVRLAWAEAAGRSKLAKTCFAGPGWFCKMKPPDER